MRRVYEFETWRTAVRREWYWFARWQEEVISRIENRTVANGCEAGAEMSMDKIVRLRTFLGLAGIKAGIFDLSEWRSNGASLQSKTRVQELRSASVTRTMGGIVAFIQAGEIPACSEGEFLSWDEQTRCWRNIERMCSNA